MTEEVYPVELTAPDIEPYRKSNIGIEFVTSFDSGKPGPHVMINAVTHGNEICGAIALDYLFKANVRPAQGKLTLGFINHLAYSNFDPNNPGTMTSFGNAGAFANYACIPIKVKNESWLIKVDKTV